MSKLSNRVEEKVLAAVGRKALRDKARAVARVGKKAAKVGLITGAVAAAVVIRREIRKARKPA